VCADAGGPIKSTAVVDASRAAVWKAFTTEEVAKWMVAHANIDLKIGGLMRTHYDPKGKLGDMGTIENTILCFDPERMFAIRNTKAPMKFPFPKAIQAMWTVVYFEDADGGKTRVTVVGNGFGDDEEAQKMRAFFQRGNDYTVQQLQKYFEKKK
jgi:uncharacterized protein YndB with AHSA1/START domain